MCQLRKEGKRGRREAAKAISMAEFQCFLSPRKVKSESATCSVVSDSLRPQGL